MNRIERLISSDRAWIADAGLETWMVFVEGRDLPHFASIGLVEGAEDRARLSAYFDRFLDIAREAGTGFVLDTATWRANMGWAAALALDGEGLAAANRRAVDFAQSIRAAHETDALPILINGVVGPSGDGYRIETMRTAEEAEALHAVQIAALAGAGVDMISAVTMTYTAEAIGIARAAAKAGLPHVVSFTLETDGRLPSGQGLHEALAEVEDATAGSPLFYMINCAHPAHIARELDGPLRARIGAIRGNASRQSHAELDAATELDDGDPAEFGHFYATFARFLPNLRIVGGCCGSDHRHVGAASGHIHAHRH